MSFFMSKKYSDHNWIIITLYRHIWKRMILNENKSSVTSVFHRLSNISINNWASPGSLRFKFCLIGSLWNITVILPTMHYLSQQKFKLKTFGVLLGELCEYDHFPIQNISWLLIFIWCYALEHGKNYSDTKLYFLSKYRSFTFLQTFAIFTRLSQFCCIKNSPTTWL